MWRGGASFVLFCLFASCFFFFAGRVFLGPTKSRFVVIFLFFSGRVFLGRKTGVSPLFQELGVCESISLARPRSLGIREGERPRATNKFVEVRDSLHLRSSLLPGFACDSCGVCCVSPVSRWTSPFVQPLFPFQAAKLGACWPPVARLSE